MVENLKVYTAQGGIVLKGFVKNGLDTSRLVNLIVCFDSPEEFRMKDYPAPPNLFFINDISFSEALGILINQFDYTQEKAVKKIKLWINQFHLERIRRDENAEDFEKIVRKENDNIIKNMGEDYKIGDNDVIIVGGFLREKINIVHAKDKGMEETCRKLGLNVIPTPKRDLEKEKAIKEKLKKSK